MAAPRLPVREGTAPPTVNPFTNGDGVLFVERTSTPVLWICKADGTYITVGGAPSGPAGGDLTGSTFPNPVIAAGAVTSAKILDDTILNGDINSAAAIAESKLSLATDAAAGTGSRRTLGTGALQAAAGNHTHAGSSQVPVEIRHTASNLILNSTSWANFPTIGTMTLTGVAAGDWIEININALVNNENVAVQLDVVSEVAAVAVNSFGKRAAALTGTTNEDCIPGWFLSAAATVLLTGGIVYQLQAGDLTGSTVIMRMRFRTTTATNRTVFGAAADPFLVWAKRLGQ